MLSDQLTRTGWAPAIMMQVRSEPCPPINLFRRTVLLCSLTALYVMAGKLGLQLAVFHPSATPVWPPTALSLSALLLLGSWVWPAIFAGAFVVNVTTAGSMATSLGIALGNTLEGLLGAFLVNRFANGLQLFARQRDTLKFVLFAAGLSTIVSATIGVTSLSLEGTQTGSGMRRSGSPGGSATRSVPFYLPRSSSSGLPIRSNGAGRRLLK